MELSENLFLLSWRSVFGLILQHQKNNQKLCESGVLFRANLIQPLNLSINPIRF